jgi:hypothetical protein
MVKLYLNDKASRRKRDYIEVSIWSLLKANILTNLLFAGLYILAILFSILVLILAGLL